MGENTQNPPKIVVTHIIFMQLIFLVMHGHHILDYFYLFKANLISFRLHLIKFLKKSTNIENFECMEYICDKIIPVTKFGILNIYFKTRVVGGILGWNCLWCMILIYFN
jgi:hypothetical protein